MINQIGLSGKPLTDADRHYGLMQIYSLGLGHIGWLLNTGGSLEDIRKTVDDCFNDAAKMSSVTYK